MPSKKSGSALKRLKEDLKESGLLLQKSKKGGNRISKRQVADSKFEKKKALAALKEKQSNPFELKITKQKHEILGRKVKGVMGRPGMAKKKSHEVRKKNLLPEMINKDRETNFEDKRIGEKDAQMSLEDKMFERFVQEQKKRASKGIFNLEDDQLTHMGKSLDEVNYMGPMTSEDEDEAGTIDFRTVRGSHFGGFGDEEENDDDDDRKKSKSEVMKEVIAKSKMHKYERQKQKEEDFELGQELDAELDELRGLLDPKSDATSAPLPSRKLPSQRDAYDLFVRELASEKRAQPTDRLKTEEEIAMEEKAKLERLEAERLKRMRGEDDEGDDERQSRAKRTPGGDDLDDMFETYDVSQDIAPLAYHNGKIVDDNIFIKPKRSHDDEEDEEEFEFEDTDNEEEDDDEEDENVVTDEEEGELDDNEDIDNMEELELANEAWGSEEEDDEDDSEQEEKFADITETKAYVEEEDSIPYLVEAPATPKDFYALVEGKSVKALGIIVNRIRVLNHVKLGPGNRERLMTLLSILVSHSLYLATSAELFDSSKLNAMFNHIFELSQQFPEHATMVFSEKLVNLQKQFKKKIAYPGSEHLILLQLICKLFAISDFKHSIAVPALTMINEFLSQLPISNMKQAMKGLFLCQLAMSFVKETKRYMPEVMGYLYRLLSCFGVLFNNTNDMSNIFPKHPMDVKFDLTDISFEEEPDKISFSSMCRNDSTKEQEDEKEPKKIIYYQTFKLFLNFSEFYSDNTCFIEIFSYLKHSLTNNTSDKSNKKEETIITKLFTKPIEKLVKNMTKSQLARRPLQLQKRKPVPISSFAPKFIEKFSVDRKNNDPLRDRAEQQKTKRLYKKEYKGAVRELKKDAYFISKRKNEVVRSQDAAYKKKINQIMGDLGGQEGAMKSLDRKKRR